MATEYTIKLTQNEARKIVECLNENATNNERYLAKLIEDKEDVYAGEWLILTMKDRIGATRAFARHIAAQCNLADLAN